MNVLDRAGLLADRVCAEFNIERSALFGNRNFPMPIIRSMIYTTLRKEGYSYPKIGYVFKKNHSTIIYCMKHLEEP